MKNKRLFIACLFAMSLIAFPGVGQEYSSYRGKQLSAVKKSFLDVVETDQMYPELKPQGRRIKNKIGEYPEFPFSEDEIVFQAEKAPISFLTPEKEQSPPPDDDFLALDDSGGSIPPDVNGAPGPDHLMVTLNTDFRIMDRQGNPLYTVGSGAFWQDTPGAGGVFDPKISYDPFANRWILVEPANSDPATSKLLIAVSETSDPTGNWFMYSFDGDPNDTHWFDYPNYGFSKDKLVVTGNLFGPSVYVALYVFDKEDLYNNAFEIEYTRFIVNDGFTLVPAKTYDEGVEDVYVVHNAGGNNNGFGYVYLRKVVGSPDNPSIENIGAAGIPAPWENWSGFSGGNSAPQLGSDERINTVDSRMENMVYRNDKLWATHHVYLPLNNPQRASVQWWNLSLEGEVLQWGRVDDPTGEMHFAFATIAVNAVEDVLVGFGSFSENQYAGASYAMRYAEDPPNTMRSYYQYKDGEAPYFKTFGGSRNRWGDYTATFVDPVDDLDFWTIQEYAALPPGSQDEWGTWWAYVDLKATPEANFTANIEQVPVNSGVNFTDLSKYNPDTWLWTFEGGTPETSTEQNPENIVYNTPGVYDVTLTASNGEGSNTIVMENYIDANTSILPEIDFVAEDTIPCVGSIVKFEDQTIYNANAWLWEFSPNHVTFMNGTSETSQHPEVVFDYPFNYTVTLTATNNNGSSTLTQANMIDAGGLALPFYEDFESRSFETQGWTIENPDDDKTWDLMFVESPGQSELAAYVNIRNYSGFQERDRLISPGLNFYAHKEITLNFEYAYKQRMAGVTDSLIVFISEDCGESWSRLLALGEDTLAARSFATAEPGSWEFKPDQEADWCGSTGNPSCISIDLSDYTGKSNIRLMFETFNSYGNNLFVDNIVVDGTINEVTETDSDPTGISVYPNPTTGFIRVQLGQLNGPATLTVFSSAGIQLDSKTFENPDEVRFDLSGYPEGIYVIRVVSGNRSAAEKVILK